MNYKEEYAVLKDMVEENLGKYLFISGDKYIHTLTESMAYSVFAGGKRLRPVLLLAACRMAGGVTGEALPFACALEYIHTYSLIHDDLPAMDDDDLRRGKPTNHTVFGEACAILAGDGLLNRAYEVMLKEVCAAASEAGCNAAAGGPGSGDGNGRAARCAKAASIIAEAAGHAGMVGGQIADLEGEDPANHSLERLEFIHLNKTGALIKAAVLAGAVLGGADGEMLKDLEDFGLRLGLAFQICDDILDITGSEAELGKPVGSDDKNGKLTYPAMVGLEKSQIIYTEIHESALEALASYGAEADFLRETAADLYKRVK